jgi:hypothetical protein
MGKTFPHTTPLFYTGRIKCPSKGSVSWDVLVIILQVCRGNVPAKMLAYTGMCNRFVGSSIWVKWVTNILWGDHLSTTDHVLLEYAGPTEGSFIHYV